MTTKFTVHTKDGYSGVILADRVEREPNSTGTGERLKFYAGDLLTVIIHESVELRIVEVTQRSRWIAEEKYR